MNFNESAKNPCALTFSIRRLWYMVSHALERSVKILPVLFFWSRTFLQDSTIHSFCNINNVVYKTFCNFKVYSRSSPFSPRKILREFIHLSEKYGVWFLRTFSYHKIYFCPGYQSTVFLFFLKDLYKNFFVFYNCFRSHENNFYDYAIPRTHRFVLKV